MIENMVLSDKNIPCDLQIKHTYLEDKTYEYRIENINVLFRIFVGFHSG